MQGAVIGQQVAILSGYSRWNSVDYNFGFTIKRITPKGQVVVEGKYHDQGEVQERRFDIDGREMNQGSSRFIARLVLDVEKAKAEVAEHERRREAADALNKLRELVGDGVRHTYDKETMLEIVTKLEVALAEARAKVEVI